MDSLGPLRSPEFQAVIIVDYDDGRLFPLTEGCPKCLLPIANRRLLAYQLDLLSKSGAVGTLVERAALTDVIHSHQHYQIYSTYP